MVEKFDGGNPLNARIKVDYSGVKPKVHFSYPDKKNQERFSMIMPVFMGWAIIWFFLIMGLGIQDTFFSEKDEITDFSVYFQCIGHYKDRCDRIEGKGELEKIKDELFRDWDGRNLFILLSLIIPPFIIYFPFRKQWGSLFTK